MEAAGKGETAYKKETVEELKAEFAFDKNVLVPVLISCYSNLFSMEWEAYQNEIEKQLGGELLVINKADNQILVLVKREAQTFRAKELKKKCELLIEQSKRKYQTDVFIIIGSKTESLIQLKKEYEEMKDQLDYQFFVSDSMLIVHDESYFVKKEQDMLTLYFERIFNCARMQDYRRDEKGAGKSICIH